MMGDHAEYLVRLVLALHKFKMICKHIYNSLGCSELKGRFAFDGTNSEELCFTNGVPVVRLNCLFALLLDHVLVDVWFADEN